MAENITKILIRQGTDIQRRTANVTGIVFNSGEPAYCVDTKRLYIGDGSTSGGNAIGIQNLGYVPVLFGNYFNGFSFEGYQAFASKGAAVGDIIYDADTRSLYALTGLTSFPPITADLKQYDFSTLINNSQFEYNTSKQLQIKNGGVGNNQLALNIVDGVTLTKPAFNAPLAVKLNGIENQYLAKSSGNTLKGNFTNINNDQQDFFVPPGTVVGRTNTSLLTAFTFSYILSEATFASSNGITINQAVSPPVWSLDSSIFTITPVSIELLKNTTIQGFANVTGNLIVGGNVQCTGDVIAYYTPSDQTIKENVKGLSSPLDKIDALNGYEFTFNNKAPLHLQNKVSYGVIAQEVEKILPHAIDYREHTGIKGVNYESLIAVLIEGIKELRKEIKKLKNEV